MSYVSLLCFFFFNDTATTEIYTLSLHDALPISGHAEGRRDDAADERCDDDDGVAEITDWSKKNVRIARSEEHTSELQSHSDLVCRLLLEKKKKKKNTTKHRHNITTVNAKKQQTR